MVLVSEFVLVEDVTGVDIADASLTNFIIRRYAHLTLNQLPRRTVKK